MRRLVPVLVLLGLAALAAVALARVGGVPAVRATTIAASGSFEIANSRDGRPIFAAANIAPGGSAVGTVTIEDTGSEAVALHLRRGEASDTPGLGGGVLSTRLRLSVIDITVRAAPRTIYAGPLAAMPEQNAGNLRPGEARTFEFTATLPVGGEPDLQNAVQGASTTVAYAWVAEEASEVATDGSPAGPTSTPTGGNGGVAGQSAALGFTVPRVRRALRRGHLLAWTHCDNPCHLTVRGRLRASASGRHRTASIHFARRGFAAGPQRLLIPIPRKLRHWLRHAPPPHHLRANLRFIATGTDGQRDVVHKHLRLRPAKR